ncbi:MAG: phage shock protein operon transcriptional activator [Parvularculaceae bacterium]|nr:phage shock protein operon transcriptional activator [Parvularculaceae bacterium]
MNDSRQPPELIGQSPAFLDALAHASAAASLDRPLLICGERGAGKELIAARIHFLSPRWDGPLIKVNCAALSDELLDSELFGHEAGAFTGATRRHAGRFERAEGGTLFLDEIASASLRIQEKLLRVIEYGEYERVGGSETLIADVRIIAAANADLPAIAREDKFRADLLDRLAFDVIAAPPLRERREDIPLLAAHFASGIAREMATHFSGFTPKALATFLAHDWPGNVRELKNAAERSVYRWITGGDSGPVDRIVIDPFGPAESSTPPKSRPDMKSPDPAGFDLRRELDAIEKKWTQNALAAHGGSQRRAAAHLRLTYDQMRGLVRKHDLAAQTQTPKTAKG